MELLRRIVAAGCGLSLMTAGSLAWGASTRAKAQLLPRSKVTASLMISNGQSPSCSTGNVNVAALVTVSANGTSRYIVPVGINPPCVVLPMTLPIGATISVSGVIQDTSAVPNLPPPADAAAVSIDAGCFNVEAFSLGVSALNLGTIGGSEFDPNAPANIINAQGFGFMWYDSDADLTPGPYTYTVTGCSGGCALGTDYYNSVGGSGSEMCTVLAPFPEVAQQASHH